MNKFRLFLASVFALVLSFGVSLPTFAAAIDVDDVVTDIAAQAVPIGLIGTAVLLIFAAIKAFKWVRRAM